MYMYVYSHKISLYLEEKLKQEARSGLASRCDRVDTGGYGVKVNTKYIKDGWKDKITA